MGGLAKEQFEEGMGHFSDGETMRDLLRCAQALRSYFFWVCFGESDGQEKVLPFRDSGDVLARLLASVCNARRGASYDEVFAQSYRHPFAMLLPKGLRGEEYALATEGLMHYILLHRLVERDEKSVASMYHFYLLILGAFHQLIVHQPWQQGFDQFQKITLNDLRVYVEKRSYEARFRSCLGMIMPPLSFGSLKGALLLGIQKWRMRHFSILSRRDGRRSSVLFLWIVRQSYTWSPTLLSVKMIPPKGFGIRNCVKV